METHWKFRNPRNISGASQRNSVAAFSYTTEVDGDLFLKNKIERKHKMAPDSLSKSSGSACDQFLSF